jgi:hypothetical protein
MQQQAIRDSANDKATMTNPTEKMPFRKTKLSRENVEKQWGVRTNKHNNSLLVSENVPKLDHATIAIEHLNI